MLHRAEGSGRPPSARQIIAQGITYLARVGPFVIERRGLGRHRREELVSQARTGAGVRQAPVRCGQVNRSAGPAVEAQPLHDRERRGGGEDLDVRGSQHAGVGAKWVRTLARLTRHRASALTGP
jgi:hypothetical protein